MTEGCGPAPEGTEADYELDGESMVGAVLNLCPPAVQKGVLGRTAVLTG